MRSLRKELAIFFAEQLCVVPGSRGGASSRTSSIRRGGPWHRVRVTCRFVFSGDNLWRRRLALGYLVFALGLVSGRDVRFA